MKVVKTHFNLIMDKFYFSSIATILVNSGTLRIGDILLCNQAFAKVNFMLT